MAIAYIGEAYNNAGKAGIVQANTLAAQAHKGQGDGSGMAYIHHPRRVAWNLWRLHDNNIMNRPTEAQIMIALLHDVIEDTYITARDLHNQGFAPHVVKGVEILTKSGKSATYDARIRNIIDNGHSDAMRVKLCDLMDNLHPLRRNEMSMRDPLKAQHLYDKYAPALDKLSAALGINPDNVWRCIHRAQHDQPVNQPKRG